MAEVGDADGAVIAGQVEYLGEGGDDGDGFQEEGPQDGPQPMTAAHEEGVHDAEGEAVGKVVGPAEGLGQGGRDGGLGQPEAIDADGGEDALAEQDEEGDADSVVGQCSEQAAPKADDQRLVEIGAVGLGGEDEDGREKDGTG